MSDTGPDAWSNWSATFDDAVAQADGPPAVTYTEVLEWRNRTGYLREVMVEAQPSSSSAHVYAVYLLTSWRPGYCALHVNYPSRPRLFRNLDRLVSLLRRDFGYEGSIELRVAGHTKGQKSAALRKRPPRGTCGGTE